jgi:hypothetical protein
VDILSCFATPPPVAPASDAAEGERFATSRSPESWRAPVKIFGFVLNGTPYRDERMKRCRYNGNNSLTSPVEEGIADEVPYSIGELQ